MFGLSTLLTLAAMFTLAYYDKLLKDGASRPNSEDDEFQRLAVDGGCEEYQEAMRARKLIERKNILADPKNCGLPRSASSNALATAYSDEASEYSMTTRNTHQTSGYGSSAMLFQSHSNMRWREPQPGVVNKEGHLESVDCL